MRKGLHYRKEVIILTENVKMFCHNYDLLIFKCQFRILIIFTFYLIFMT